MCTRRSFSCLWRGSLDCDKLGQLFQGAQSHCGETTGELEAECGEGAVQTRTEGEEKETLGALGVASIWEIIHKEKDKEIWKVSS